MNTKLFVGNLSYNVTENDLQDRFSQHGPVTETAVVVDKMTGRPRGFAFVTMATKDGAEAAIQALNGVDWDGRALTVNEARPRAERSTSASGSGQPYRSERY
jgi:RNA recognition motif-containing protein